MTTPRPAGYSCPKCGGPGHWRRGVHFDHEKRCERCDFSWEPGRTLITLKSKEKSVTPVPNPEQEQQQPSRLQYPLVSGIAARVKLTLTVRNRPTVAEHTKQRKAIVQTTIDMPAPPVVGLWLYVAGFAGSMYIQVKEVRYDSLTGTYEAFCKSVIVKPEDHGVEYSQLLLRLSNNDWIVTDVQS